MKECIDAPNLHRRLKKILGQVAGIDKMVEQNAPCEEILTQIHAAKSALHRVGQMILEDRLEHCVREGLEHGDVDKTLQDVVQALEQFRRMS